VEEAQVPNMSADNIPKVEHSGFEEMEVSKILVQSEVGEKYESPDLLEFDLMGPNMT
jgi:hypothetical protein